MPSVRMEGVKCWLVAASRTNYSLKLQKLGCPLSRLYEMFMRIAGYEFRSRPHTTHLSRGIPLSWELWCWQINNWKIRIIPELSSQNFKLHKSPTKTKRKVCGLNKLFSISNQSFLSSFLACASQICFC